MLIAVLYTVICVSMYVFQEDLLFFPTVVAKEKSYQFQQPFEERWIPTADGVQIHGLMFRADSSRGLVFFLHGNGGCAEHWLDVAELYTSIGYDFFVLDYRGFGKSEGTISSEAQFYGDVLLAYNAMLEEYTEDRVTVIGFSIGTAAAAMLAAKNRPARLILQAPYYSLGDMVKKKYPLLPEFLLKYPFRTFEFVEQTECPITIFHGTEDRTIYPGSSEKLLEFMKPSDKIYRLAGHGHNGISQNSSYRQVVQALLN